MKTTKPTTCFVVTGVFGSAPVAFTDTNAITGQHFYRIQSP